METCFFPDSTCPYVLIPELYRRRSRSSPTLPGSVSIRPRRAVRYDGYTQVGWLVRTSRRGVTKVEKKSPVRRKEDGCSRTVLPGRLRIPSTMGRFLSLKVCSFLSQSRPVLGRVVTILLVGGPSLTHSNVPYSLLLTKGPPLKGFFCSCVSTLCEENKSFLQKG